MLHFLSRLPFLPLVLAAVVGVGSVAHAGSPLMCFAYEIGDAKCLPWSANGPLAPAGGYDRANVVADTLGLLKTEHSILVRMETMRRATIYVAKDRELATELLGKLAWMALDAEAAGNTKWARTAWFDAGFLAACYQQMGVDIGWKPGVADGLQGWAWMKKAIELGADDPAVQYAAALVLCMRDDGSYRPYLARAVQGAEPGSDLARSIERNGVVGGAQARELRTSKAH
jgi:hypothetical protein